MRLERSPGELRVEVDSAAETMRLGRALAGGVGPGVVIGLVGPLGAGKTTLSRAIAEALGAPGVAIASPTFVLIHEYPCRPPVYHFDAYRIGDPEEFEALGIDEYFEGDGVCLVEWADRFPELLPGGSWWLTIEPADGGSRRFRLRAPEAALDRVVVGF